MVLHRDSCGFLAAVAEIRVAHFPASVTTVLASRSPHSTICGKAVPGLHICLCECEPKEWYMTLEANVNIWTIPKISSNEYELHMALQNIVTLVLKACICVWISTEIRYTSEIFHTGCLLWLSVNINIHITINQFWTREVSWEGCGQNRNVILQFLLGIVNRDCRSSAVRECSLYSYLWWIW